VLDLSVNALVVAEVDQVKGKKNKLRKASLWLNAPRVQSSKCPWNRWMVAETGTLRATQAEPAGKLEMVDPEHQSITHVQVFVVRRCS
jgi:hypothetical protein